MKRRAIDLGSAPETSHSVAVIMDLLQYVTELAREAGEVQMAKEIAQVRTRCREVHHLTTSTERPGPDRGELQ